MEKTSSQEDPCLYSSLFIWPPMPSTTGKWSGDLARRQFKYVMPGSIMFVKWSQEDCAMKDDTRDIAKNSLSGSGCDLDDQLS
ncbi:hypothetical protein CEXT_266151 [Caerostris extrusa]|uniref:Uncharacterized protein n=1 Tax=Caerostris extrusa TaxID=172846 RepID=A0AAV4TA17_CAEEX|nr:hypothetical protein CEXT_266151 [Caerostris extrusa]